MMKKPDLQIALTVFAFLSLAPFASADSVLPRLRLESESLSSLQSHSGQRVILTGYFRGEFEASDLPDEGSSARDSAAFFRQNGVGRLCQR